MNNTQIKALAQKITNEINEERNKNFSYDNFKDDPRYIEAVKHFGVVKGLIYALDANEGTKESLLFIQENYGSYYGNPGRDILSAIERDLDFNDIIYSLFKGDKPDPIRYEDVKNDIILATITSSDMDSICKQIKAKYL